MYSNLRNKSLLQEFEIDFKILVSLILYAVYGCVLCNEEELQTKRTNEIPYIFMEYGDYIFVCAVVMWCDRYFVVPERQNIPEIIRLLFELWTCVICTNIAIKQVWIQVIIFTSIWCSYLSDLMLLLYNITSLKIFESADGAFKSETCEKCFLTTFALLAMLYLWDNFNTANWLLRVIQDYYRELRKTFHQGPNPPVYRPLFVDQCNAMPNRSNSKGRGPGRRKRKASFSNDSDLGNNSQYVEPINGPILSDKCTIDH